MNGIYKSKCICGKITHAADPTIEGTSFGVNFLSFITSTRTHTGSSFENISRLINDLTGINPSQTMIYKGLSQVSNILEPIADNISREVMNSDYIHIDETSHKLVREGKNKGSKKIWVWIFSTKNAAYYHVDLTRGQKAVDRALLFRDSSKDLPISVSDAYPVYVNAFPTKQFCWAHLLRESHSIESISGKILHDLVDIFQKMKAMLIKLENESGNEKVYQIALKWLRDLVDIESDKSIRKIQKHIKLRNMFKIFRSND